MLTFLITTAIILLFIIAITVALTLIIVNVTEKNKQKAQVKPIIIQPVKIDEPTEPASEPVDVVMQFAKTGKLPDDIDWSLMSIPKYEPEIEPIYVSEDDEEDEMTYEEESSERDQQFLIDEAREARVRDMMRNDPCLTRDAAMRDAMWEEKYGSLSYDYNVRGIFDNF